MAKVFRRLLAGSALLAVLLAAGACNRKKDTGGQFSGPPGQGPWAGGDSGPSTPIKEIMNKLTKGPQSLTSVIGRELQQDPPPWDTIGPQAKEFAQLAADMSKYDPPKGSKDSWLKLTSAYAGTAADLDKAAKAQDRESAVSAHETLSHSCMACHRAHHAMGPGMGGMPIPPGGKVPPGMPPPPQ
jgi:hypothetical protein